MSKWCNHPFALSLPHTCRKFLPNLSTCLFSITERLSHASHENGRSKMVPLSLMNVLVHEARCGAMNNKLGLLSSRKFLKKPSQNYLRPPHVRLDLTLFSTFSAASLDPCPICPSLPPWSLTPVRKTLHHVMCEYH